MLAAALALALAAPALAYDPLNGDFSKDDALDVRLLSYNHMANFISDPSTDAAFARILTAISPDIICFQECPSSMSQNDLANRLDSILPTAGGWDVHFGILAGTRTALASRYGLSFKRVDTFPASSTRGVTIALADLPDADYPVDVYLLGVHLKCCGDPGGSEDQKRQDSTDAMANWLGDARGVARPFGENISLPADTPMIALGDFNFVGGPQPRLTLLEGDIQDETGYGPDVKGDWDVSDLTDAHPTDPFTGDDFTWQGSQSFPPGRLDQFFYTDSAVSVASSFVLNTDTMSAAALANAGLQAGDTLEANSSDHLPLVVDLRVPGVGGGTPMDVPLSSVNVTVGTLVSGGVAEADASDDSYVVIDPALVAANKHVTDVTVRGFSPITTVSRLDVRVETGTNRTKVVTKLFLNDRDVNTWVQLDKFVQPQTDTVSTFDDVANPNAYLRDSDGLVRVRIFSRRKAVNPHQYAIDEVAMTVVP